MEEVAAMVMRSCASLCERCEHYDWQYTKYGREACEEVTGLYGEVVSAHRAIWCAESDRPETERWGYCPRFKELS